MSIYIASFCGTYAFSRQRRGLKEGVTANKYFGTDGFRGRAGSQVSGVRAFKIGMFLGWYFGARRGAKCRAVIGKDTRLSSYMLEYSLCAGLCAAGADAHILHVTTTPSVAYIARCENFDVGIMISASHNPYGDNGIKLISSNGEKLKGRVISLIERYLDGDLSACGGREIPFAEGEKIGRTVDYISGRNRYIGHLISLSTCSYKGLKVGLDGANGSAFSIARSVFDALGAKTYVIGDKPDGLNVNAGVGSTDISALRRLVEENGLDIGFAFDGDADRCLAVDERGEVISGDGELYILANYLKSRSELNKCGVVCTVMSNGGLKKSLENCGIYCEFCGVGDKTVCETMSKNGLSLGGERSGHIVISKLSTTGDGLVTAISVMEALVESKGKASGLLKGYFELPQINLNFPADDKRKTAKAIAAAVRRFNCPRAVVRPSGTEPCVRVMLEGENARECADELTKKFKKGV